MSRRQQRANSLFEGLLKETSNKIAKTDIIRSSDTLDRNSDDFPLSKLVVQNGHKGLKSFAKFRNSSNNSGRSITPDRSSDDIPLFNLASQNLKLRKKKKNCHVRLPKLNQIKLMQMMKNTVKKNNKTHKLRHTISLNNTNGNKKKLLPETPMLQELKSNRQRRKYIDPTVFTKTNGHNTVGRQFFNCRVLLCKEYY